MKPTHKTTWPDQILYFRAWNKLINKLLRAKPLEGSMKGVKIEIIPNEVSV